MGKILSILLLLANTISAQVLAKDGSVVDQLSKKYSEVSSYYTAFEGENNYKGEIYYQAPNNYRVVENGYTTIVNDSVSYKIDPSIKQVIISKADDSYSLYSPIGLMANLKLKFNFSAFNKNTNEYEFIALDKYDAIKSIYIKINSKFFPEYIMVHTNDERAMKYSFKKQTANKSISKDKFEYKKQIGFEEIDIR